MKRFLLYLLLLLLALPLGGACDCYAVTKKAKTHKTTAKKSTKKSYGKKYSSKYSSKYGKKGSSKKKNISRAASQPVKVESYNYGSGPKAELNVKPQVQRVVTRKKRRRIVTYKRIYTPPISLTYCGIDISHHQHTINWQQVAATGTQFVYIKASEGETFRDTLYEENVSRARAAGVKVGSYLYFHPNVSVKRQFENFRDIVREEYQDLIPMVDVEETSGMNRKIMVKKLNELLEMMTDYYGQRPIIYTATSFYNSYLQNSVANYPIVVGGYTRKPVLLDDKDYVVWQFSSHGKVNGINSNVDLDVFNTGYSIKDILFDIKKVTGSKIHRSPVMPATPDWQVKKKITMPQNTASSETKGKKQPIKKVVKVVKTVRKAAKSASQKTSAEPAD